MCFILILVGLSQRLRRQFGFTGSDTMLSTDIYPVPLRLFSPPAAGHGGQFTDFIQGTATSPMGPELSDRHHTRYSSVPVPTNVTPPLWLSRRRASPFPNID